jgi:hypothetical protein
MFLSSNRLQQLIADVKQSVMVKYSAAPFLFLIFFSFNLAAQKKKEKKEAKLLTEQAEWFEGSIMLTDGSELKGLVKYNNRNGVLSYQDGIESKVFTPVRVVGFEFFDESLQKQRVFYTFNFEDSETNIERPLFFEVLKEYKTFAVLTKSDRIDVGQKVDNSRWATFNPVTGNYDPMLGSGGSSRLVVSQTETIYLMKETGEIKPYFKVVKTEDGEKSFVLVGNDTKTKNKMIDRDLLNEFIPSPEYEKLIQYAETNNLKFKKKEDFMEILKYYDETIAE